MRLVSIAAAVLLLSAATAFAADPVGEYVVNGTNPGSASTYRGTVRVERTGETFRVTWYVAGVRYVGTAIGDSNFIAISYRARGNDTGLALYGAAGDDWKGVWTYANGRQIGTETWKRE